jgi:hypothetical protein
VGTIGGNVCPACANEGEQTLLGANPFAYHRLQPDFVLEALVRKIFPDQVKDDYNKLRPEVWARFSLAHFPGVLPGLYPCT